MRRRSLAESGEALEEEEEEEETEKEESRRRRRRRSSCYEKSSRAVGRCWRTLSMSCANRGRSKTTLMSMTMMTMMITKKKCITEAVGYC